jgi:cation diffusion facilitator family transporter
MREAVGDRVPQIANGRDATRRLLILSGLVDFVLGVLKVVVGSFAQSHALIADGIHSLSDLATDVMVWVFSQIGSQAPDESHPYGHARFETFGTFLLGGLLLLVAGLLVHDAVMRLIAIEATPVPSWPALVVAIVSIASKEWLYQLTRKLGQRINSRLLMANAWHHRSDAWSSVIVLVGVGGAIAGVPWLEMLAAIGVAIMIAQIGLQLARQSVEELVDTALSDSDVREIRHSIESTEGVKGVHGIRSRKMGQEVLLDIHLQVESNISVSEGHHIGEWATHDLQDRFPEIGDISVHIDAEDDAEVEEREGDQMAPLRQQIRQSLETAWRDIIPTSHIQRLTLHYLNNKVNVDLYLDSAAWQPPGDPRQLKARLIDATADLDWLNRLSVWYD